MNTIGSIAQLSAILGLISNLIGSLLLAYSLNKVIQAIFNSFQGIEQSWQAYADSYGRDIHVFRGLDQHREIADKKSQSRLRWGVRLVVIGFILQLAGLLIDAFQTDINRLLK